MEAPQRIPNIVLLPPPVFLGHMIPFIELANKLVSDHNCTVTLVIPHDGSPDNKPQKQLLEGNINMSTEMINPIFLPPVPTDDLPEDAMVEVIVMTRVIRSLPSLHDLLASLRESGAPPAALVVDLFATYAIDVARELDIPAYMFYIPAANSLSLCMELVLMKRRDGSLNPESVPDCLPGSIKLSPSDYLDSMKDTKNEGYTRFVDLCNKLLSADGILVNSFLELESEAFNYFEKHFPEGAPPVYPVGPLIRKGLETEPHKCLEWLDDQPRQSVLYVSFGSGGGLSAEQIKELALGLESSEQRFLWVVRRPQENAAASYLDNSGGAHDLDFLPRGFVERTKGRGLVVGSWVPQVRVLSHVSTGGFLMHCGWNSILESAVFGVPMIGWPLCYDQKVNAVVVKEVVEGAMRVKANEDGIVEREQIAGAVMMMMEGEEGKRIRKRMKEVKIGAGKALMKEYGSSAQALAKVVEKWKSNGE